LEGRESVTYIWSNDTGNLLKVLKLILEEYN